MTQRIVTLSLGLSLLAGGLALASKKPKQVGPNGADKHVKVWGEMKRKSSHHGIHLFGRHKKKPAWEGTGNSFLGGLIQH